MELEELPEVFALVVCCVVHRADEDVLAELLDFVVDGEFGRLAGVQLDPFSLILVRVESADCVCQGESQRRSLKLGLDADVVDSLVELVVRGDQAAERLPEVYVPEDVWEGEGRAEAERVERLLCIDVRMERLLLDGEGGARQADHLQRQLLGGHPYDLVNGRRSPRGTPAHVARVCG